LDQQFQTQKSVDDKNDQSQMEGAGNWADGSRFVMDTENI
jgi:hypothetical protein